MELPPRSRSRVRALSGARPAGQPSWVGLWLRLILAKAEGGAPCTPSRARAPKHAIVSGAGRVTVSVGYTLVPDAGGGEAGGPCVGWHDGATEGPACSRPVRPALPSGCRWSCTCPPRCSSCCFRGRRGPLAPASGHGSYGPTPAQPLWPRSQLVSLVPVDAVAEAGIVEWSATRRPRLVDAGP